MSEEVESALVTAYQEVNLGLPTAFPNRKFVPPTDGALWAGVSFAFAQPTVATLGTGGEDETRGFMQVDFNIPIGAGRNLTNEASTALQNFFTAGRKLVYGGTQVDILSCGKNGGFDSGKFYKVPNTITFYARHNRN